MSYATVEEYKARVGMATATEDGTIAALLAAASDYIDDMLSRTFTLAATASQRYFDGSGSSTVWVDDIGTTADLAVAVDLDGDWTYETELTIGTQCQVGPPNALARNRPYTRLELVPGSAVATFPERARAVRVTAHWGWPSVPPLVKEATVLIARQLHDLGLSGILMQAMQIEAAVQRSDILPRQVQDLQRTYGRRRWL